MRLEEFLLNMVFALKCGPKGLFMTLEGIYSKNEVLQV